MTTLPEPYGPIPTPRQLRWHELEIYGFIHFSINTFIDKEWGYGDESPELFDPTDFDADQIVRVARDAGLRGLVLTCKHHDGFCLWPSPMTEHSVKNSPWKNGQGDMVREFSDACARHGLKFGVYLSPWDRNRADYGEASYLEYYRAQLRDLLTHYGEVFEVWFDGANGGDGYYGGAREMRRIDAQTYYDWENTWKIVRELQPNAVMFSDVGPDIRWCGNEDGYAGDPCWPTINTPETMWPGHADLNHLNRGDREGARWLPCEVDVSIRPGWFYHASEDDKVKSVEKLRQIYYESVGRGASLILNLPPDRRGQIHSADEAALVGWRAVLEKTFARDLARKAHIMASNSRGVDGLFAPAHVADGAPDSYWATDDGAKSPELVLQWNELLIFDTVRLREFLPLGQRVHKWALDVWRNNSWCEIASGQSIGNARLVEVEPVTTSRLRLRIVECAACPAIAEVGVFLSAQ